MTTAVFNALACDVLESGRTLRFRAHGGSMRPFIRDGDVVEVAPVDAEALRRGDVVLRIDDSGRPLVHRVVEIAGRGECLWVKTQGDAMACADGTVEGTQVLGRVTAVERRNRRIALDRRLLRGLGWMWLALSPVSRWLLVGAARLRACASVVVQWFGLRECVM
jgi:signal peptidase I